MNNPHKHAPLLPTSGDILFSWFASANRWLRTKGNRLPIPQSFAASVSIRPNDPRSVAQTKAVESSDAPSGQSNHLAREADATRQDPPGSASKGRKTPLVGRFQNARGPPDANSDFHRGVQTERSCSAG